MDSTRKPVSLALILPLVSVGLLFTVIGLWLGGSAWEAVTTAVRTEGTVVALVQVKSQ